jgi:hypothetical protein
MNKDITTERVTYLSKIDSLAIMRPYEVDPSIIIIDIPTNLDQVVMEVYKTYNALYKDALNGLLGEL